LFPEVRLHFFDVAAEGLSGLSYKRALSPMIYARLLMADASGWDKFVYLDLDLAVTGDVAELFETDLGDNLVGACVAGGVINSGVLLVNGRAWREEGIREEALRYAAEHQPKEGDQATIEAVCGARIQKLDPKWNVVVDPVWGRSALSAQMKREAAITHYVTGFKPWNLGYVLLPPELRRRYAQYVVRGNFPISWKREAQLLGYQVAMLARVFVVDKVRARLAGA
jgi:lipopolysaccharide biosynthesis glycosyltransferase